MPIRATAALLLLAVIPSTALAREQSATGLSEEERAAGYVSLFNGKDLSGWQGSTSGYTADGGVLICRQKGGGKLYTEQEYSDFSFRFEFKLTEGANNGIGIRTPLKGDPAFAGIEIQILDNKADRYKNLKDYQYHGSIYGVVPAKRGYLKPVGEWNSQEIICRGKHIKVILNGETIVDAGHIAFCGNGANVEFRNIRVKELAGKSRAADLFENLLVIDWPASLSGTHITASPLRHREDHHHATPTAFHVPGTFALLHRRRMGTCRKTGQQ